MRVRKSLETVLKLANSIVVSLFMIGVAMEFIQSDFGIGFVGVLTFFTCYRSLNRQLRSGELRSGLEPINNETKAEATRSDQPYRFTFTHDEQVLDAIESTIADHPLVEAVFQDSGYWYSNGETGPEWFSMTVECKPQHALEIEHFINALLIDRGKSGVRFISS